MTLKSMRLALLLLALACSACGARASQASAAPPATVTFTVTSTLIPSPVPVSPTARPTLPPAPRTFTEAFDLEPANWSFAEVDNGQPFAGPTTRDGFLVFDLALSNQWAYAFYAVHDYADVTIETEMQSRTAGDGAGGVVCRYDEKKGWYEFNVRQDQTYQLLFGQWLAPGVARYTPLYQGNSGQITSEANRIGLHCQGNILTPSINGVQLRRWQEQKFALQEGQSGLSASSFDDTPFTIAFDWVKVSEP
jgi:hypothetical protein